jgi:hypothetical protein
MPKTETKTKTEAEAEAETMPMPMTIATANLMHSPLPADPSLKLAQWLTWLRAPTAAF